MRKIFCILSATATALLASPGMAQESVGDSGLYLSFAGGISETSILDNEWIGVDPVGGATTEFVFDYSLVGTGALGYAWMPSDSPAGFRLEVEGSYRRSELDYIVGSTSAVEGYVESIGAMANGYVDFNFGPKMVPYVGGGFGMARVSRRDFSVAGVPATNKYVHTGAWQVMGGLGFRLSPGTIIGVELRYFELMEFQFENTSLNQNINFGEALITLRLIG